MFFESILIRLMQAFELLRVPSYTTAEPSLGERQGPGIQRLRWNVHDLGSTVLSLHMFGSAQTLLEGESGGIKNVESLQWLEREANK